MTDQITDWWAGDLALSDSDPVSSWTGRVSGLVLGASGTARPTYRIINGRAWVDFDGTNDVLTYVAANAITTGQSGTIFAVVMLDVATGGRGVWSSADEASASRYILGTASSSGAPGKMSIEQANGGALAAQVNGDTALATGTPYLLEWTTSSTAYTFRVNGVAQTLTVTAGLNAGNWFGDVGLRDVFALGALKFNGTATAFLDGKIAHFTQLAAVAAGDRTAYYAWVTGQYPGITIA